MPTFIVMGPAGAGKTTVGRVLAGLLGVPLLDADDFHSAHAVAQMRRGVALTEADRQPWLERLAGALDQAPGPVVLCCSALRASYRHALGVDGTRRRLVYLEVPEAELSRRLREREGHFADASLLGSQLATLESPGPGQTYDGRGTPLEIAQAVLEREGVYP